MILSHSYIFNEFSVVISAFEINKCFSIFSISIFLIKTLIYCQSYSGLYRVTVKMSFVRNFFFWGNPKFGVPTTSTLCFVLLVPLKCEFLVLRPLRHRFLLNTLSNSTKYAIYASIRKVCCAYRVQLCISFLNKLENGKRKKNHLELFKKQ